MTFTGIKQKSLIALGMRLGKMRKLPGLLAWAAILLLPAAQPSQAQGKDEKWQNISRIELPFEYENNLIVVTVIFNRVIPLRFIFDTGAEHTILAKREFADLFGCRYEREFRVLGADMKTELTAYLVRGIHLKLTGGTSLTQQEMNLPNHSMLVLAEDYLKLETITGTEVHGILGADAFRNLVVKIDYRKRVVTLINRSYFQQPEKEGYQSVALDIKRNKPYLETYLQTSPDSVLKVRLLLDSGAMVALLLNTGTHAGLQPPPNAIKGNVGTGLGGFIEGYLGRIQLLQMGTVSCPQVLTHFQDLSNVEVDSSVASSRDGVIGNALLRRFDLYIDYPGQRLYYRPNRNFKAAYEFDKSGLVVIATGAQLNNYLVHSVLAGSPAAEAGILAGDEILRVNRRPALLLTLPSIQQVLRRKAGKSVSLVLRRNGAKFKAAIVLRELI